MAPDEVARLQRIPWCAELIADKNFVLFPTGSRQPKESKEDSFVAETLQTDRTIRAWVSQYSVPDERQKPPIRQVRSFLDLGDGLNGYPAVCHGGMVATMLDEIMGVLLTVNAHHAKQVSPTATGINSMTAYLKVTYKKPLPLPSVVLGTAEFTKIEGRKSYGLSTLEDGNGNVYAIGEALFVEMKPKI